MVRTAVMARPITTTHLLRCALRELCKGTTESKRTSKMLCTLVQSQEWNPIHYIESVHLSISEKEEMWSQSSTGFTIGGEFRIVHKKRENILEIWNMIHPISTLLLKNALSAIELCCIPGSSSSFGAKALYDLPPLPPIRGQHCHWGEILQIQIDRMGKDSIHSLEFPASSINVNKQWSKGHLMFQYMLV